MEANKELSYEPLKSIIACLNVGLRSKIESSMPDIAPINRRVPYHFKEVCLGESVLEMGINSWRVEPTYNFERRIVPNLGKTTRKCGDIVKVVTHTESKETLMNRLMKFYFREPLIMKTLRVCGFPLEFTDRVNLRVKNIRFENQNYSTFTQLKSILEEGIVLESLRFPVCDSTQEMFEDDVVKRAEQLTLQWPLVDPIDVSDHVLGAIKNKSLCLVHPNFPIEKVQALIMNWVTSPRPVGSTFFLTIEDYVFVLDVFDLLKPLNSQSFHSKRNDLDGSFFAHSLTIPIDFDRELVLHGGPRVDARKKHYWSFRMEMMWKGSTTRKP